MKKTLAIFLACAMLLVLFTACSGTGSTSTTAATTAAATTAAATTAAATTAATTAAKTTAAATTAATTAVATTAAPATTANAGGSSGEGYAIKFDPPITVTGVRTAVTASMADLPLDDNSWTQLYLDRHGIILEYLWVCDGSQYNEKVNLAIMSGEIPDIMQVTDQQYQQLYEADLLTSVDSAFYDYATADTITCTTEQGELAYEACKRNGELYAIPFVTLIKENARVLYLRQDWLDKTGSPNPTDLASFEQILADFANPDLGGVNFSICDNKYMSFFTNVVCPIFGGAYTIWIEKDGGLAYGAIQPEIRDALAQYVTWYQNGYIDPEFITNDGPKIVEKIASSQIGLNYGAFSSPLSGWTSAAQLDENIEMSYFTIPTVSGDMAKIPIGTGIAGYWVASAECEHPEAITLMINDFIEKFYLSTSEEDANTYIDDIVSGRSLWQHSYCRSYRGFKNYQQSIDVGQYLNGQLDYENLTADSKGVATRIDQFNNGDISMWGWNEIYGLDGIFGVVEQLIKNDSYIQTAYYGAPTESMGSYNSTLDDLCVETFTDITVGKKDISYFDTFVEEYLAQGGQKIQDEVNEWYANK